MMMEKTYLVAFGELFGFLNKHGLYQQLSNVSGFAALSRLELQHSKDITYQEMLERFDGTWWEVEIPIHNETSYRCTYVADSLKDALRLKPGINLSPWSSSYELLEMSWDDTEDYEDDNEDTNFIESLGML